MSANAGHCYAYMPVKVADIYEQLSYCELITSEYISQKLFHFESSVERFSACAVRRFSDSELVSAL